MTRIQEDEHTLAEVKDALMKSVAKLQRRSEGAALQLATAQEKETAKREERERLVDEISALRGLKEEQAKIIGHIRSLVAPAVV